MTEREAKQAQIAEIERLKSEADRLSLITREVIEADQIRQRDDRNAVQQAQVAEKIAAAATMAADRDAERTERQRIERDLVDAIWQRDNAIRERDELIAKYEPERIDENGVIRPRLVEEPQGGGRR